LISIEGFGQNPLITRSKSGESTCLSARSSGHRLVNFRAGRSRPTPSFPRASAWETVARYKEILGLRDA
jgi:hypothetical protein